MQDLFAAPRSAPGQTWQRVSPRLATIRHGVLAALAVVAILVVLLVTAVVEDVPGWVRPAALVAVVAAAALAWWGVARNARRWGYAEGTEELFITRGALFRTLIVVPYGRMQFVDVHAGPVEQLAGIASVHLHTASPGTTARIPGLPAAEAGRLRDRLTERGESWAAGL